MEVILEEPLRNSTIIYSLNTVPGQAFLEALSNDKFQHNLTYEVHYFLAIPHLGNKPGYIKKMHPYNLATLITTF